MNYTHNTNMRGHHWQHDLPEGQGLRPNDPVAIAAPTLRREALPRATSTGGVKGASPHNSASAPCLVRADIDRMFVCLMRALGAGDRLCSVAHKGAYGYPVNMTPGLT